MIAAKEIRPADLNVIASRTSLPHDNDDLDAEQQNCGGRSPDMPFSSYFLLVLRILRFPAVPVSLSVCIT